MMTEHDVTNDAHRERCDECQALWAELDAISAEAAKLPALTPSRDLWPDIEARLAVPTPRVATPSAPRRGRGTAPIVRLATAASLLIAVTATATWQLARRQAPTSVAAVSATAEDPTDVLQLAAFTETVAEMDREIATLESIVRDRNNGLDSSTVAVLETNLALIDRAIAESRAALAADPGSQFLAAQFTRAYTSKLSLLRDVATLPTGI